VPPAASASTRTSIASPFSACTITSAPVFAATSMVRKSLVVDLERALVRHEELVGRDALRGQRRELLEPPRRREVGDGDVEPMSMIALSRLACQSPSAWANVCP
jgi:hypothetical protein